MSCTGVSFQPAQKGRREAPCFAKRMEGANDALLLVVIRVQREVRLFARDMVVASDACTMEVESAPRVSMEVHYTVSPMVVVSDVQLKDVLKVHVEGQISV